MKRNFEQSVFRIPVFLFREREREYEISLSFLLHLPLALSLSHVAPDIRAATVLHVGGILLIAERQGKLINPIALARDQVSRAPISQTAVCNLRKK
jgi:hypothetical protein